MVSAAAGRIAPAAPMRAAPPKARTRNVCRNVAPSIGLLRAVRELLLGDREGVLATGLYLDILHQAMAAFGIDELHVVLAGRDALEVEPFVGVDRLVIVIQALVGAPLVGTGKRQIELVDLLCRHVPEAHFFRGERAGHAA